MNTPVDQVKGAAAAELRLLRSDLETALKAHKWFMLVGFAFGVAVGIVLAHL